MENDFLIKRKEIQRVYAKELEQQIDDKKVRDIQNSPFYNETKPVKQPFSPVKKKSIQEQELKLPQIHPAPITSTSLQHINQPLSPRLKLSTTSTTSSSTKTSNSYGINYIEYSTIPPTPSPLCTEMHTNLSLRIDLFERKLLQTIQQLQNLPKEVYHRLLTLESKVHSMQEQLTNAQQNMNMTSQSRSQSSNDNTTNMNTTGMDNASTNSLQLVMDQLVALNTRIVQLELNQEPTTSSSIGNGSVTTGMTSSSMDIIRVQDLIAVQSTHLEHKLLQKLKTTLYERDQMYANEMKTNDIVKDLHQNTFIKTQESIKHRLLALETHIKVR